VGRDDDAAVTNEDEVDEVGISQDELLLIPNINHTHTHTHARIRAHTFHLAHPQSLRIALSSIQHTWPTVPRAQAVGDG
jgi:hypothetical protein